MAEVRPETSSDRRLKKDTAAFYDAMSELIRVYQFRDRDRICCHGISVTQCYALEALVKRGPLTMNELAARLYLDKSTTSRVVGAMERKELIQRRTHAQDRRAVLLECTGKGRELHRRIRQAVERRDGRLLAGFAPAMRTGMIELMRRITRAAEERVEAAGGTCSTRDR